jgi:hypothetical protein
LEPKPGEPETGWRADVSLNQRQGIIYRYMSGRAEGLSHEQVLGELLADLPDTLEEDKRPSFEEAVHNICDLYADTPDDISGALHIIEVPVEFEERSEE